MPDKDHASSTSGGGGKSAAAASSKKVLAPASESGDPAVHQALAELEIHRSNGDDAAVRGVVARLNDLGFSA
jgi:hypothetical protein